MPSFPVQGGSKDIWGTMLRDFFAPYFNLDTGALLANIIGPGQIAPQAIDSSHFNTTGPGVPTGVGLTSGTTLDVDGKVITFLRATWNAVSGAAFYEWRIRESAGNYIHGSTGNNEQKFEPVKANVLYEFQVRAVDVLGNRSAYSTLATLTTSKDNTTPGIPSGLSAQGVFRTIFLTWTNPTDSDLSKIDIYRNTVNNPGTATKIQSIRGTFYADENINAGSTYYYWLKAVDWSGNESGFSVGANATAMKVGDIQSSSEIADAIISTTKLVDLAVTSGKIADLAVIQAKIANAAVGSAQIADAAIINAKIANLAVDDAKINDLNASKINAGDIAAARMQVNAANAINAGSVKITPGQIVISGATTLADWRYGGDNTLIDGGDIAANTVLANRVVIGSRGVSIVGIEVSAQTVSANRIDWTVGTIEYINDAGSDVSASIASGNATWSTGILYLYWVKGATTLSTTTSRATAFGSENVVIAAYGGGTDLVVNYGRTIIDGSDIVAATITATKLTISQLSAIASDVGTLTAGVIRNAPSTLIFDLTNSKLTCNVTGGLEIQAADGITILNGASLKLNAGGDIYLTDDATNPSEIRWRKASDTSKYWTLYKSTTDEALIFSGSTLTTPYIKIGLSTSDYIENLQLWSTSGMLLYDRSTGNPRLYFRPDASDSNGIYNITINRAGGTLRMVQRSGTPEGIITADPGTLCMADISGTIKLFLKATGTGNTGWVVVGTQT